MRTIFIGFLLCVCCLSISAQNPSNTAALNEAFEAIEQQFKCAFSYKDKDLQYHRVQISDYKTLTQALSFLEKNTLFNYTVLPDRAVAVRPKEDVKTGCLTISDLDGMPLENIAVRTPYQALISTSEGKVSFAFLDPSERIVLSHPSHRELQLKAGDLTNEACAPIVLEQKVVPLNTVVITNYLAKGISKSNSGYFAVNYDEFSILPGLIEPDVLQTIQALPGIQSVNETVSYINIRGGTNDQNLILWDGIKMYQTGHFFGLISAFNPHLTNRVTVQKNGSSASYGDGVSGIISLEGDSEINKEVTGGWGLNLISTDVYLDLPLGSKASLQISGRKSINNLINTPTYEAYFDKAFQNTEVLANSETQTTSDDSFSFFDTSVRLLYQPTAKDYIRVNFLVLGNRLEFLENARVDFVSLSRSSDLAQNNISAGLFYKRSWTEQFFMDIQFYGSSYNLEATNSDLLNNQRLLQKNKVLESGVKTSATYNFSSRFAGKFGYQLNETGITNFEQINNPFFEREDKQVLVTHSVFSEIGYTSADEKTIINLGLRMNHISKFNEITIEPRLTFNHRFLQYFTAEILGELKSQTTSQVIDFQNDFLGVENRRWVLSNPNAIPILKGQQLSFGLSYAKNGLLISAEPYIKHIDGITSQSQGFQNQFQDRKTHGSYFVKGVDVLLNKRLNNINTWLSYSFAENDYTFDSFQPKEFPNNINIRHSITYGINYDLEQFKLSGGLNWHSGKPTTELVADNEVIGGELNYGAPNATNIDDYFRVDLSTTYTFAISKKLKGFAGLSVWNVLNTKNVVNTFYQSNHSDALEQINENALHITPNATFRISF